MGEAKAKARIEAAAKSSWRDAIPAQLLAMIPALDDQDREWVEYCATAIRIAEIEKRGDHTVNTLRANMVACLCMFTLMKEFAPEDQETDRALSLVSVARGMGGALGLVASNFTGELTKERCVEVSQLIFDEVRGGFDHVMSGMVWEADDGR